MSHRQRVNVKPKLAICGLLASILLSVAMPLAPAAAQGVRHAHLAYADTGYGACRIGWWQTVVYGHVRPHWAVFCR